MSPRDRRDLRELLVSMTDSSDHRRARIAEHLSRVVEQIDLATAEERVDDSAARAGLMRARIDVYASVRSVLAVLEAERRRAAK